MKLIQLVIATIMILLQGLFIPFLVFLATYKKKYDRCCPSSKALIASTAIMVTEHFETVELEHRGYRLYNIEYNARLNKLAELTEGK